MVLNGGPATHATRRFRWSFAALLAGLATLGPFSIDAYLPAFAGIQASLAATPLEIQQTLSGYLFAFGVMFLFHGALSDSFGRRPVILVALVVYTIASTGAALATSAHTLIVWRVIQGLSVGAGMVVGRAMIRDLFGPEDAQRLMSMVTLFFGLAPAIAPVIGGWLFVGLGWRSVFWFLAVVGLVLVAVSWRFLPETLAESGRQSFHPMALLKGYREVGIDFRFLLLSLSAGFNFNAFFLYIVSAPVFMADHLGLGPTQYAWLFGPCIAGIMIGAQLSGRAAGRASPPLTVQRAYAFMAIAAGINTVYAFAVTPSIPWAVIPLMVYGIGFAMAMPSITLITLDLFPTRRGMAASLQGFVSGMVNVITAGVISPLVWHSTRSLALAMMAMMIAGFLSWRLYLRSARARQGGLPPAVEES
ncbi:MAG TPA: multidrug effflux MFS transporter [Usitatibacter sp.]|jgi:DHA1 family bicyclomycin/chloramphenicol resistance-like MFS transporter|nr:multidrug effflux MFS transporter [Usitatibacter sp.]